MDWTALGSVSEWAPAAGASFAALAAGASWVAVQQTRRDFVAARRPDLEISVIEGLDTGSVKIHIQNHGKGAARNAKFVVVQKDEAAIGFLPPNATLAPGESRTLLTPMGADPDRAAIAVVSCNDGDGYVHAWKVDGRHRKWKLSRPWNASLSDEQIFKDFYPETDPFSRTLVRYRVADTGQE